jgi:hypothetical protein
MAGIQHHVNDKQQFPPQADLHPSRNKPSYCFSKDYCIRLWSLDHRHQCTGKSAAVCPALLECNKEKMTGEIADASARN